MDYEVDYYGRLEFTSLGTMSFIKDVTHCLKIDALYLSLFLN